MRVCIIYKEDYPWDVRVEKIARTLVADGHEVTLVCRNNAGSRRRDKCDGFFIQRLPSASRFPYWLRKLLNFPFWFNPVWIVTSWRTVRRTRANVILVRDLPLMLTGAIIARAEGARLYFDMAECYPEMYKSSQQFSTHSMPKSGLMWALKNPTLASLYERLAVRLAHKTLVMIEESRDRLLAKRVSPARVCIVSNTPRLGPRPSEPPHHVGTELRIVYVGFLTPLRGLDLLIQAIHEYLNIVGVLGEITLDIVGQGEAHKHLSERAKALKLTNNVMIHGWLPNERVRSLVMNANVGALTYRICGHWNHTIPNKLFDYMLSGLPVVSTKVRTIGRIVRETNSGLLSATQEPRDIAATLLQLRDASLRNKLGVNGYRAVRDKYNWAEDADRLRLALRECAPDSESSS